MNKIPMMSRRFREDVYFVFWLLSTSSSQNLFHYTLLLFIIIHCFIIFHIVWHDYNLNNDNKIRRQDGNIHPLYWQSLYNIHQLTTTSFVKNCTETKNWLGQMLTHNPRFLLINELFSFVPIASWIMMLHYLFWRWK